MSDPASGEAFKDWMRVSGWTVRGLSDALGVSERMITYYRAGRTPPPWFRYALVGLALERHDRILHLALTMR